MAQEVKYITPRYIQEFFKLGDSQEEQRRVENIYSKLERRVYQKEDVLCKIGEAADGMYFIEEGHLVVINKEDEAVNELVAGQYFGEYAIIAKEKRLSTVKAEGKAVVYYMSEKDMLEAIEQNPSFYGHLIKNLYNQLSAKHTKLLEMSRSMRGITQAPSNRTKMSFKKLLTHYGIITMIFLLIGFWFPSRGQVSGLLLGLPILFLLVYIIVTKRIAEAIILATLLCMIMIYGGNFITGFSHTLEKVMVNEDTVEIIIILALMGGMVELIEGAGGAKAFKRYATRLLETRGGVLFTMWLSSFVIFIDDYLCLLTIGPSLTPLADEKKVPREITAFILGIAPAAVCSLVPISLWGIYISGVIGPQCHALGVTGIALFTQSVPYNFFSIFLIVCTFLLSIGKLPRVGVIKRAEERVKETDVLWPPESKKYVLTHKEYTFEQRKQKLYNFLIPIVLLIIASIAFGIINTGYLVADMSSGMIVTLLSMFILYVLQRLMTPEDFIGHIIKGTKDMMLPIILMILTLCFANSIQELGFIEYVVALISTRFSQYGFLLPAILFVFITILDFFIGASWSIYAITLPIIIPIATSIGVDVAACVGAICAGGVAGDALCLYQSDNYVIASVVGCEPMAHVKSKIPYGIGGVILCTMGYILVGFIHRA